MHNVLFMAEGQVIGRASWSGSLAGARRYALDYMRVRKADHVEVRDDEDEVVFQHPEESSSVH